ncbi:thiamine biosynthesis lipoprotein [Micromonospora palomenae]|uniref:FAD:protein FMN transferase n=1 Tax=Micromonospora palomenae TaxID=1461247 RepID=A0A561WX44_9ACTN|nr:FAD:protein FMN transferase [Micromonospora palomenae]TWG28450.1 thiamine biosynthesis lipoprotein [Micromonospora palomenae]
MAVEEVRRAYRGRVARVAVTDRDALPEARRTLVRLLAGLRRAEDELARAHRAAGRPVPVGPLLRDLVAVALGAAEATGGDVDPTVGAARLRRAYARGRWPVCGASVGPVEPTGNWRAVRLRGDLLAVPATLPLALDGTATAYLVQRAAERIAARTGVGALVGLGTRTAVAGPAPAGGWPVAAEGRVLRLTGGALVTADGWRPDGGGVLDPRTGGPPASPWRAVTVAAPDATRAAMLAIAALVRGDAGPDWLAGQGVAAWPTPRAPDPALGDRPARR